MASAAPCRRSGWLRWSARACPATRSPAVPAPPGRRASGKVRSTTGRTPAASQNAISRRNSSRVPMVEPITEICRKNSRCRSADGSGPLVAPQQTMTPPGRTARIECDQVDRPTDSKTPSTRSGSRAPGSKTWWAPRSAARARPCFGAGGRPHPHADGAAQLDQRGGHPAGGALHQDGRSGRQAAAGDQHPVGRQVGGAQGRGRLVRHRRGQRQQRSWPAPTTYSANVPWYFSVSRVLAGSVVSSPVEPGGTTTG